MEASELKKYIIDIPDFPKAGIVFKDISPLLASAKARSSTVAALASPYLNNPIDVVVGIEARGFLFGMLLAQELNASFVMVRKPNKLPGDLERFSYDLEYGTDSIEIQRSAIAPGSRVLIHDDVLATGGTAAAAAHLIEKAGGKVVSFSFIMELDFLQGREKLGNYPTYSIIHY